MANTSPSGCGGQPDRQESFFDVVGVPWTGDIEPFDQISNGSFVWRWPAFESVPEPFHDDSSGHRVLMCRGARPVSHEICGERDHPGALQKRIGDPCWRFVNFAAVPHSHNNVMAQPCGSGLFRQPVRSATAARVREPVGTG